MAVTERGGEAAEAAESPRLSQVAPKLWCARTSFRPVGLELGTRATLVQTEAGLVVHSPCELDEGLQAEVRELGRVAALVAPSKVHHLFVPAWKRAFPDAELVGARGLHKKRKDVAWDRMLGGEPDDPWNADLLHTLYEGAPLMNEVVFFHPESSTLLLTDLAFNVRTPVGWWTRSYLKLSDAYLKFGQSWVVKSCTRDRDAANRSIERILEWDFDRVVMTHGEVLESGGKDALRSVFTWLR